MPPILAIVPFATLAVIVFFVIVFMDWRNNKNLEKNLEEVAFITSGKVSKEDGYYSLEGSFQGREYSIFFKTRGIGKNKTLYYYIKFESSSESRLVSLKRYVKSRLEARINEMTPVHTGDDDFDRLHKIYVENESTGKALLSRPEIVDIFKNIMGNYTEMSIKKDITLLKRYHVNLTSPQTLLQTLDDLSKIATEAEKIECVTAGES